MFLLPWSTGAGTEKVLPPSSKIIPAKPTLAPLNHVPFLNNMKRKHDGVASDRPYTVVRSPKRRNESSSYEASPPLNRALSTVVTDRPLEDVNDNYESNMPQADFANPSQINIGKAVPDGKVKDDPASLYNKVSGLTPLQQMIESQFSLEILLKHRELRLIDQELAKCQIALEQLRRCEVMPYPATTSDPDVMQSVSSGLGPAYDIQAQSPSPWGVTDGPYARHYAKWLIPDSTFGDNNTESLDPWPRGGALSERATRGSKSSARTHRGNARDKLQALPLGYPESKEDKGPMIVKRASDGQMVKLVCLDCRRDNFNSAQGFINHCRIAHNRGFASHEQAAIACGEELETDAAGIVIGPTTGTPNSLVHPLIRSGPLPKTASSTSSTTHQRRKRSHASDPTPHKRSGSVTARSNTPSTPQTGPASQLNMHAPSPFRPSARTPHLSALFARDGRGGDLEEMVAEAMIVPEIEPESPMADGVEDEDEDIEDSAERPMSQRSHGTSTLEIRSGGRLPARSGISPAPLERTPSSKGVQDDKQRRPGYVSTIGSDTSYNSPFGGPSLADPAFVTTQQHQDASPPTTSLALNHSPSTIESHPAPSLVSDDGDYENTHSESEVPSSAMDSDDEETFEVQLHDFDHHSMDLDAPNNSSTTADYGMAKTHRHAPQPARRRPSAMKHASSATNGLGQRRVNFQSPTPQLKNRRQKRQK